MVNQVAAPSVTLAIIRIYTMDEMYFVFEVHEDEFLKKSVRVKRFSHSELEEYVNDLSETMGPEKVQNMFVGPHNWPKWFDEWKGGETIIIRGKLIQPIPETEVVKFKIPYI